MKIQSTLREIDILKYEIGKKLAEARKNISTSKNQPSILIHNKKN